MIRRLLSGNWRQRFSLVQKDRLAGQDLAGNRYYEYDHPEFPKPKRRVEIVDETAQLGEWEVPTLWHSWLRGTRQQPPTMEEQQREVARLELAAQWREQEALEAASQGKQVAAHAAMRAYELERKAIQEPEPTRATDFFQPGAWQPDAPEEKKQDNSQ